MRLNLRKLAESSVEKPQFGGTSRAPAICRIARKEEATGGMLEDARAPACGKFGNALATTQVLAPRAQRR